MSINYTEIVKEVAKEIRLEAGIASNPVTRFEADIQASGLSHATRFHLQDALVADIYSGLLTEIAEALLVLVEKRQGEDVFVAARDMLKQRIDELSISLFECPWEEGGSQVAYVASSARATALAKAIRRYVSAREALRRRFDSAVRREAKESKQARVDEETAKWLKAADGLKVKVYPVDEPRADGNIPSNRELVERFDNSYCVRIERTTGSPRVYYLLDDEDVLAFVRNPGRRHRKAVSFLEKIAADRYGDDMRPWPTTFPEKAATAI